MKVEAEEVITFGRYEGVPITSVPRYYLRWVISHCDNISTALKRAIEHELSDDNVPASSCPVDGWEGVLCEWYLAMRNKYGGDLEKMKIINDAEKHLRLLLGTKNL